MSKFDDRAVRYMTDLIRDFQLEDFMAAGFPGNFGVETGGFEHVQEINPIGGGAGGLGDAQWTGMKSRRGEFEAWLARRKAMGLSFDPGDYDANYSMVFRELDGGEGRRVLPKLRQARTVDEATEIVMREYERPGVEHLERRKEYGRQALTAFRARGIDVAALKAQGRPGAAVAAEQEVLPPLAKQPPPDLQALLTVLGPLILPLLQQFAQQLASGQPLQLAPPAAEPPKPAPVTPTSGTKPSVALGLAGLFASAIGMATGTVGTPFGVGVEPTTAGTLSILIPAAVSAIGATGVFGPFGAIAGRMLGAAFSAARAPQ